MDRYPSATGEMPYNTNNNEKRCIKETCTDNNEWGNVDTEVLTMSIRSRLSTELSYALTTFTLLSTMRGQTAGSGFPIFQCVDLLDEMLHLLVDQAFDGAEDLPESIGPDDDPYITTNRELVNTVYEVESQPFAVLQYRQGSKDPDLGPRQRPANVVLAIINIIRTIPDNLEFISRHQRLVDLILCVCRVARVKGGPPSAASSILSLGDPVTVRKDTLYTLTNIAGLIQFSSNAAPSEATLRMANRAFQLIASYLVDPTEAVSPLTCVQLAGIPLSGHLKPPSLPDISLEVFTRLSQTDSNRKVFAKAVPQASIWRLFVSLVHRLPVVDADFQLVTRELWLSYLEKNIMAIYSLAFLAPPELKRKVKTNRSLGFTAVMLRMIQKFLMNSNQEGRMWFLVCARKAIEAMKVVDKCEDSFETPKSTLSTMAFGMGYGEVWENGADAENVGVRPWLPRPLSVAETRWAPTDMSGSLALHMMLFTNISLFIIPLTCLDNSSTF
jgi:SWI/SNF chromatin-remodeling complex subunit SWI1